MLSISRLCEALALLGIHVRVITTNKGIPSITDDSLTAPQWINGVEVFYYPVDDQNGLILSQALCSSLSGHLDWADILHLSSIWQPLGIPVQEAAHRLSVPVIQTLRGALGPYSWRRGWWKKIPYYLLRERPALQRASVLHCTTHQEAREIQWLGLSAPIHVLPNPIDLSQLHNDPSLGKAWRARLSLPAHQPLLLVVGRLHHKKGLDLLPEVLKALEDKNWQILFVGDDDDGTARILRQRLGRLGLAKRCHWHHALPSSELTGPYNAADWLLLPSRHENFGNVVVEALACGCGALLSEHVGVADSLRSCPGVFVAERTKHSWVQLINRALRAKRPGLCAEDWVKDRYSNQLIACSAIQLYTSLLSHV